MPDPDEPASPIVAAADVAGERETAAFSLLGNEARLGILLALWEAYQPFAAGTWDPSEGNAVAFSDLQARVGMADSGQFNYHLGKLEGHFVERTDAGYQLLPAGQRLVQAVVAGTGLVEPAFEPAELDLTCQHCGGSTAITYRNQRAYHVCRSCPGMDLGGNHPDGVLSAWPVAPNVVLERPPADIYAAVNTEGFHTRAMRRAGLCPECSGPVDVTVETCEGHEPTEDGRCPECGLPFLAMVRSACRACKAAGQAPVWVIGWGHPVMVAFAWDHGFELGYGRMGVEYAEFGYAVDVEEELVSAEPPRVRITYRYEGDAVALTFDEGVEVVETSEDD